MPPISTTPKESAPCPTPYRAFLPRLSFRPQQTRQPLRLPPRSLRPAAPCRRPASGGSSLTEMALNPCGQHSASPHAAGQAAGADLTPAQQQACKHNENLRQQLNPQDWSQVLYQIGKNTKKLEGATFSKGIVTLKGDKEALAGAAYDKALKENPRKRQKITSGFPPTTSAPIRTANPP